MIPLLTAVLAFSAARSLYLRHAVSLLGAGALLAANVAIFYVVHSDGMQVTNIGGWPAGIAIPLVADLFSAIMLVLTGLIGLATAIYAIHTIDRRRDAFGFYPLLHVLLMGVCGAFLTGDLFNLYVWFEVMLIASFVLIALGNERAQIEGAIKYVTLNLVATVLLLASIGITYGLTGTLNMAALSQAMTETDSPGLVLAVSMLFLAAFSIKAAAFPFFFWLPASYHTPPAVVSALFAGLLTKVGVYALIRVFTLIFTLDSEYTRNVILFIAGATMLTGVLGTVAQHEFRRILSFHIVSQIGYMLMGLGLASPLALAGSVLYLVHIIIVKANLFLISGLVHRLRGTYELKLLGGMFRSHPGIAALFAISALSLGGIPPFSGFFAKFVLVRAGLEAEQYAIVGVALGVSLLTVFSMAKIWREAFWKPVPEEAAGYPHEPLRAADMTMIGPIVAMAALIVGIGLGIEPLLQLTRDAAEQLSNPAIYVGAVLGGGE